MEKMAGFGVAGNFAGHLEQAGEAESFRHVQVKETQAPKAIFPFYVPSHPGFLSVYPLSSDTITFPNLGDNLQIEPEVAIVCQLTYDNGNVSNIKPLRFAAYNDCSIRNPNATKISHKKNWGEKTKGISDTFIDIDFFDHGGILDQYRIACYLNRDGKFFEYGIDSPVSGYSYNYQKLLDWVIEKMNHQIDEDPTEPILPLLQSAGNPEHVILSIGATRYTDFGQRHFLQKGDKSIVVVYDGKRYSPADIATRIQEDNLNADGISPLVQKIV